MATVDGGAVYLAAGSSGPVTLTGSTVTGNHPGTCAPAGSVPHCTDPAGSIRR